MFKKGMKLLIFISLSIFLERTRAEGTCSWIRLLVTQGTCLNKVFQYDEPLHLEYIQEVEKVEIKNSTGSISAITLSPLYFVIDLRITDSTISKIEDGAFCSLPKLEDLYFDGSKLPVLQESTLMNCGNLISLSAPGIEIELDALKHMPKLRNLVISNVKMPHLTNTSLGLVNPLENFTIWNFEVSSIDPGFLCTTHLSRLQMQYSVLPTLSKETFKNCDNVIDLKIEHNKIPSIEEGAFTYFTSAKFVAFDGINIVQLTKKFLVGLENVLSLAIINSGISEVSKDAFVDFNKLTKLSLSGNKLTDFDPNTFAVIPKLDQLDLSHNQLTNIDNIKSPVVEKVVLSVNISTIKREVIELNLPKARLVQVD